MQNNNSHGICASFARPRVNKFAGGAMVAVMLASPALGDTVTNLAYPSVPTSWSFFNGSAGTSPTVAPDGTRTGVVVDASGTGGGHYVRSQVSGHGRDGLHFFQIPPRLERRPKFAGLHWQECVRETRPKALLDIQRPHRRIYLARPIARRLRDRADCADRLVACLGDFQADFDRECKSRRFLGNQGNLRSLGRTARNGSIPEQASSNDGWSCERGESA